MFWNKFPGSYPIPYEYCLICSAKEQEPSPISLAQYDGKEWILLFEGDNNAYACGDLTWSIEAHEITHWMYAPKSPKTVTYHLKGIEHNGKK